MCHCSFSFLLKQEKKLEQKRDLHEAQESVAGWEKPAFNQKLLFVFGRKGLPVRNQRIKKVIVQKNAVSRTIN